MSDIGTKVRSDGQGRHELANRRILSLILKAPTELIPREMPSGRKHEIGKVSGRRNAHWTPRDFASREGGGHGDVDCFWIDILRVRLLKLRKLQAELIRFILYRSRTEGQIDYQ